MPIDDDSTIFQVVVNHEEQYSIWPVDQPIPDGWTARGPQGPKAHCLDHIETVWTDMRPLSLRRHMDGPANGQ
jgi:MbtH protein